MSSEDRLARVERIIDKLADIALSTDQRMDMLGAAQENSETKIAALTDAQIRTEAALEALIANQETLVANQEALVAAQANSETKIAALADAQIRTEGAMTNLTEKMAQLAEAQAHTDQRLDALIDIVRERYNGKSGE